MNRFLKKQGEYVLQQGWYAFGLVMLFSLVPFASSLALTIIALLLLRKGTRAATPLFLGAMSIVLFFAWRQAGLPYAVLTPVLVFLLLYCSALLLRWTANWTLLLNSVLSFLMIFAVSLEWFFPEYVLKQFLALLQLFQAIDTNSTVVLLLKGEHALSQKVFAAYLLGIKLFSVMFSAMIALFFARYVQSLLFCRGGLFSELMMFRASKFVVILFFIGCYGVYLGNLSAIVVLPILAAYLSISGLMVMYALLLGKKNWFIVVIMFLPLMIVPYVMLPIYILLGALESVFPFKKTSVEVNNRSKKD